MAISRSSIRPVGAVASRSASNVLRASASAKSALALYGLASVASFLAAPAFAQDAEAVATAPLPASSVCLSNTVKGGTEKGRQFVIAVPSDKAEEFLARGYAQATCARIQQADKSHICDVAAANDPAVNAYFWDTFGFTPEERCKLIEAPVAQ